MNKEALERYLALLQSEAQLVSSTLKEKGLKRFARPLIIGALAVYMSYSFVYAPPIAKTAGLAKKLAAAKAAAQYADTYKSLRDRLLQVYSALPTPSDRDQWLTKTINESLNAHNIIPDSLRPPAEAEDYGLVSQKLSIPMHDVKFSDLVLWLNRVESTQPMLHVTSLEFSKRKDKEHLGQNDVTCSVSTLIPTQRLVQ